MKHTIKKAMSILLAFMLVFGSFAFGLADVNWSDFAVKAKAEDSATSGACGGNLTWTFYESTGELVISGTGGMYDYDWNKLTMPWYSYYPDIKTLTINNGVTNIGDCAFYKAENLMNISIPDTVVNIGEGAFYGTGYDKEQNNWENDLLYIGKHLVNVKSTISGNCKIKEGTLVICENAFYNRHNVTSVIIPDSVIGIGEDAFFWSQSLENITVDTDNKIYSTDQHGVLFNKDKTELIKYPEGNTSVSYTIPDSVKSIGQVAFYWVKQLEKVIIPKSVTTIGMHAFYLSGLTSVEIPDSVTSIGELAFECCPLKTVTIGNGITSIEGNIFCSCYDITSITIPNSVINIGKSEFELCNKLTDVYYYGTESEWKAITIGENNEPIHNATIHFNNNPKDEPTVEPTTKPAEIPTTTQPVVTKPLTTKPVEAEPTTAEPTKPVETKPTTTKPATTKPESTTEPAPVEEEIIKKPSTSTVKYGETLILHADFANVPDDAKIEWSVEGNGVTIVPSEDGKTCAVTSTSTGDVTITAKYTDANGVEHVSEQELESNASFWQKIVSFFKNLFGISRIIEQAIKF